LARDKGVSARSFRQLLDADDAREQLNTEIKGRDSLVDMKPIVMQPEEESNADVDLQGDGESNAKVQLQGLEEKVTDFLSQFLKRIEKLEMHARELSDTLVRQVASLERRWTDAKQRIDSLAVNPKDLAAVSGKNIPREQSENDELAPTLLIHHQDLARRIDTLVCRIAALELSGATVPGFTAPGTNEHVANGSPELKPMVVPEPAAEASPGRASKDEDVWQKSRFRLQTMGVLSNVSAGAGSGLQINHAKATIGEGPKRANAAASFKPGSMVTV